MDRPTFAVNDVSDRDCVVAFFPNQLDQRLAQQMACPLTAAVILVAHSTSLLPHTLAFLSINGHSTRSDD